MSAPLLELENIRKVYGAMAAVDGVSLSVARGEFVSLLGPSGSGKTTTLHMIAGLLQPTSGAIRLAGQAIDPLPPHKRNIGVVFQNYALFPHLTVAGNIGFPLKMRNVSRPDIDRRVAEVLALVDLPDHADRYPPQLSGGQQQRVALARAIVFEPSLLLMDEPLGALDKKLREQMQIEIKRLHRRLGVTILYVTHDQDEALVMSDRIAVFNQGRIVQAGSPAELYDRPRTRFVAEFIGESNVILAVAGVYACGICRLHVAGIELRAAASAQPQPALGGRLPVSLRPERIRLTASHIGPRVAPGTIPPAVAASNTIEAVVSEVIYMGRQRKYSLRAVDGSLALTALAQVHSATGEPFPVGARVTASWHASDLILLDAMSD